MAAAWPRYAAVVLRDWAITLMALYMRLGRSDLAKRQYALCARLLD